MWFVLLLSQQLLHFTKFNELFTHTHTTHTSTTHTSTTSVFRLKVFQFACQVSGSVSVSIVVIVVVVVVIVVLASVVLKLCESKQTVFRRPFHKYKLIGLGYCWQLLLLPHTK